MITGETIAEFDAAALRVDASAEPLLRFSLLSGREAALAVQDAWQAPGDRAPEPQFHWPAVYNRHSDSLTYVLHDGDQPTHAQAMIQCYPNSSVPCDRQTRGPFTYVSFLEIAPWNLAGLLGRFRGLGGFVVAVMSSVSLQRGTWGTLALHSLDNAAGFYRRLGFEEIDCLNEYKELYFELSHDRALALRVHYGVTQ